MATLAPVMMTVNTPTRRAYLARSLRSIGSSINVVSHEPGERTATENMIAALRAGVDQRADWVLFLEDDIEACEGFLERVSDWLDAHATDDRHVYSFSVPHQAMNACRGAAWDYPIAQFCCTQAFALRTADAASLAYWLTAHPTVTGPDGATSTGAYDLAMRAWAEATWPDVPYFVASNPSLVQHVGDESTLAPGRAPVTMPTWTANAAPRRPRLLWVGDAASPTGFARATHGVLETLSREYDVTVLGINYNGDPHGYPYPIYVAQVTGDAFGVNRLIWMCDLVKPDLIVVQQDPWNFPFYLRQLAKFDEYWGVPVVGVVAVDGKNCRGAMLNGLTLAIFWTAFGAEQARLGGYTGPSAVVPLGVDLETYYPADKRAARIKLGLDSALLDYFVVGSVNRNQPRKRPDLVIEYFAEWVRRRRIDDAFLAMHVAPTGDNDGIDCRQYASYYRAPFVSFEPSAFFSVTEDTLRDTYNAFDVVLNPSMGEGFGLTTFEAMACGVPVVASDWSALGELCQDAAWLVPCTATANMMGGGKSFNSIGGVMDREIAIGALDALYRDHALRRRYAEAGLKRVSEPRFRWANIGRAFSDAVEAAMGGRSIAGVEAQRRGLDPVYINGVQSNPHAEVMA